MLKFFIGLIVAVLIVPGLLPSSYQVERSILIDHPQKDVFDSLVNLDSWKDWSPWLSKEPSADHQFHGIPGVVGSYTSWKGKDIGEGKQTLIALEAPTYLETQLEFFEPKASKAIGYMKVTPKDKLTEVTWGMRGELSYPLERVVGLFIPSMVSADFEQGLINLKQYLESTAQP